MKKFFLDETRFANDMYLQRAITEIRCLPAFKQQEFLAAVYEDNELQNQRPETVNSLFDKVQKISSHEQKELIKRILDILP